MIEKGEHMEDETKTHIEEPKAQGEAVVVRERRNDGIIYVGKKGTMGYVLAVITQFNNGAPEVTIKARGNLISKSVDVAEIVRHRFMPSCQVKNISIKTEELASEDGSMSKVSAMEIILTK